MAKVAKTFLDFFKDENKRGNPKNYVVLTGTYIMNYDGEMFKTKFNFGEEPFFCRKNLLFKYTDKETQSHFWKAGIRRR